MEIEMNVFLLIGSLLGIASVIAGLYTEYDLNNRPLPEISRVMGMAVRYNQVYAVIVSLIGMMLLLPLQPDLSFKLKWTAGTFILGTILFSFNIYVFILRGKKVFLRMAPFGSGVLITAWLMLGWVAITLHL